MTSPQIGRPVERCIPATVTKPKLPSLDEAADLEADYDHEREITALMTAAPTRRSELDVPDR